MNNQSLYWDNIWKNSLLKELEKYSWDISEYNWYRCYDIFIQILKNNSGKNIIEIGCGGGNYLLFLNQAFNLKVYGIDKSEKGSMIAKKYLLSKGVKSHIRTLDLFDLSEKEKYDIVVSFGLIEHFKKPFKVIRKCYNVLRNGGLLITSLPNLESIKDRLKLKFHKFENENVYNIISKKDLLNWYSKLNMINIKTFYFGLPLAKFLQKIVPKPFKIFENKYIALGLLIVGEKRNN
jgi:2-polyprenyl-3-methyl-5-hydroxy-6-metoxy-1,4-benzoquinol methylase